MKLNFLLAIDRCDFDTINVHLSEMQNMWDLTPDTDLLMELPEDYNFEAAITDLIVSSLAKQTINSISYKGFAHINTNTIIHLSG